MNDIKYTHIVKTGAYNKFLGLLNEAIIEVQDEHGYEVEVHYAVDGFAGYTALLIGRERDAS